MCNKCKNFGHELAECRRNLRDEAGEDNTKKNKQVIDQQTDQTAQPKRPKHVHQERQSPTKLNGRDNIKQIQQGRGLSNVTEISNSFQVLDKEKQQGNCPTLGGKLVILARKRVGVGENPPLPMDSIDFWNTRGINRKTKHSEMHLFMHNTKVGLFGILKSKI